MSEIDIKKLMEDKKLMEEKISFYNIKIIEFDNYMKELVNPDIDYFKCEKLLNDCKICIENIQEGFGFEQLCSYFKEESKFKHLFFSNLQEVIDCLNSKLEEVEYKHRIKSIKPAIQQPLYNYEDE